MKISVLHIPHSSRFIPAEERARFALSDIELNAELLRMTDSFTDELFPPTDHEAQRIVFPVSRLVCDVERFPDDGNEPMATRGMGAVYTVTSTGARLRTELSAAERERIMKRWYDPHHTVLTSAVDEVLARHGRCIIFDCHSFSAHPLPHEPDQDPRRPDICVGTDPVHTPPKLISVVARLANDLGWSVAIDRPFAGALLPTKHYRADDRVNSIMIEVNRQLYMDEQSGERLANFQGIKDGIGKIVSAAIAFLLEG